MHSQASPQSYTPIVGEPTVGVEDRGWSCTRASANEIPDCIGAGRFVTNARAVREVRYGNPLATGDFFSISVIVLRDDAVAGFLIMQQLAEITMMQRRG